MTESPSVVSVRVDFGDASDDHFLPVIPTSSSLVPGQVVLLFDDEGNQCAGVVKNLESGVAWVEPAWQTWVPNDRQDPGVNLGPARAYRAKIQASHSQAVRVEIGPMRTGISA
jgi:hypothetical protein